MEKYEIGDLINLFWASFILIYMYPAKTKLDNFCTSQNREIFNRVISVPEPSVKMLNLWG